MKTLCFGGTFNPIHHGHLICARAAAEAGGFDRVLLIPSGQPPLKASTANMAAAADRLAMCELAATQQSDLFAVEDWELRQPGASYTLNTARELKQRGLDPLYLLIGSDNVGQLIHWHEPETLLHEVKFVTMFRAGIQMDWTQIPPMCRALEKTLVATPSIDISSSDIRRRIAQKLSIDFLTPAPVAHYIREHKLYGA